MSSEQKKLEDVFSRQVPTNKYVSFEFFPPRTEQGMTSLIDVHMAEFAKQRPEFIDVTWGAGGTTSDATPHVCISTMEKYGLNVNMHLTCTNMEEGKVRTALDLAKSKGIRNIVALRGDPPAGQEWKASAEGFGCALDLIKFIRENYGDYFSIAVAGYPEGHPDKINTERGEISDEDMQKEIDYLVQKVNAGASCIITQLFYDSRHFINFVKRVREAGITVPILPGLLPIVSYPGLQRIVQLCKTYLPPEVKVRTEELKDDGDGLKAYGVELATKMIQEIIDADVGVNHFHFYTLNNTHSTMQILKNVGWYKESQL